MFRNPSFQIKNQQQQQQLIGFRECLNTLRREILIDSIITTCCHSCCITSREKTTTMEKLRHVWTVCRPIFLSNAAVALVLVPLIVKQWRSLLFLEKLLFTNRIPIAGACAQNMCHVRWHIYFGHKPSQRTLLLVSTCTTFENCIWIYNALNWYFDDDICCVLCISSPNVNIHTNAKCGLFLYWFFRLVYI